MRRSLLLAVVATAAFTSTATAVAPVLLSAGEMSRRPTATFSAPRAADATLYIATSPDRATNGRFFEENVKDIAFLTDSEIQTGVWSSDSRLDPGQYWMMLRAGLDFSACFLPDGSTDPACADGYSEPLPFTIPRPVTRYAASARQLRFIGRIHLRIVARPLGERRRYKLCYRTKRVSRRCLAGILPGFSWESSAEHTISVRSAGLRRATTFTWLVENRRVASLRVRVSPRA